MCHPGVVIGFQALMAGAQYIGEKRQAEATYDYQLEKQELTIATAADAARHQYQGIADRTMQARAAAAQDVQNAMSEYRRASASSRVAAAAGGVMGASVDESAQDFASRFENYHSARMKNLSWEEAQLLASARGIESQHRGRVEGTMFAPVAMPSAMGLVASIGQGVMDAYKLFPTDDFWGSYAQDG